MSDPISHLAETWLRYVYGEFGEVYMCAGRDAYDALDALPDQVARPLVRRDLRVYLDPTLPPAYWRLIDHTGKMVASGGVPPCDV